MTVTSRLTIMFCGKTECQFLGPSEPLRDGTKPAPLGIHYPGRMRELYPLARRDKVYNQTEPQGSLLVTSYRMVDLRVVHGQY